MSDRFWNGFAKVVTPAMLLALAVAQPFRGQEGPKARHATTARDYEWDAMHECTNCRHVTKHRFIQWFPDLSVTATCSWCGIEADVP